MYFMRTIICLIQFCIISLLAFNLQSIEREKQRREDNCLLLMFNCVDKFPWELLDLPNTNCSTINECWRDLIMNAICSKWKQAIGESKYERSLCYFSPLWFEFVYFVIYQSLILNEKSKYQVIPMGTIWSGLKERNRLAILLMILNLKQIIKNHGASSS